MTEHEETSRAGSPGTWPFVLLGLALFAVGVAAWRPVPAGVWHDDGVYMLVGKALSEGRGFVYAGVVDAPPAAKFPPMYPAVLAALWAAFGAIGPVTMAATFLNLALLATGGALFAHALARATGTDVRMAVTIAALAFVSSDVLRVALIPLSESLFLFLLALALALWPRVEAGDRRAAGVLALTLAALVATRAAGLALVLAYGLALFRARGLRGVGVAAPSLVVATGWAWWSARASERIVEGARDLLGNYGGWLADQTISAPTAFLSGLPRHALGVAERAAALAFPGGTGAWLWVLAAVAAPLLALGMVDLVRRFPPLGWYGLAYLAVLLVWPYLDRRLLVPWHPVAIAALVFGGAALLGRLPTRARAAAAGLALVWVVAYTSVTAGRIAEGWPTAPYRLRSDRLAAAVAALERTAPPEAVVGAPEFWAALHLHGGWTVTPSVRFDPRRSDQETPLWGTPEEQLALWRATGVDHLLLEQNGMLHGETLDRLEEACPGTVSVLARMESAMVVRLDRTTGCTALQG